MPRKTLLLGLLLLATGTAKAQAGATASPWSAWKFATTSAGATLSTTQYRWQAIKPCAPEGCQIAVQLRNTNNAPAQFHYSIYLKSKGATQPVAGDASLKAFGGSQSGTEGAGDTTDSRVVTGTEITRVVVEVKADSSKSWGPYRYSLLFTGNDLTPDATMNISESIRIAEGLITITEDRTAGSVDPSRTPGLGIHTQMCKPESAHTNGSKIDDGTGELYIPSPVWEVQLTCAEGTATALFLSEKDATSFVQLANSLK